MGEIYDEEILLMNFLEPNASSALILGNSNGLKSFQFFATTNSQYDPLLHSRKQSKGNIL